MLRRVPLPLALAAAALSLWFAGAASLLVLLAVMAREWTTAASLLEVLIVFGLPGAAIGAFAVGWPAHAWLSRTGAGLGAYAGAGAAIGSACEVLVMTGLALWVGANSTVPSDYLALAAMTGALFLIPAGIAGMAAAATLWTLRRPDVWRKP